MGIGEEDSGSTALPTAEGDGEDSDIVIGVCTFSDSEDESCRPAKQSLEDELASMSMEELRERFAQSLRQLDGVHRNNHRERNLAAMPPETWAPPASIFESGGELEYINAEDVSQEAFSERFSKACKPCMILGAATEWRAMQRWSSREELLKHYGNVPFKISEIMPPFATGKPLKIELPLRLYMDHAESVGADFPFYIFERDLEGPRHHLNDDYEWPKYFRDDVYDTTEYTRAFFPQYRYMVIGAERTGSNMHIDPSCTGAWNTLLCGMKRWVLFPPGDSVEYRTRIGALSKTMGGDAKPPAYWWLDVLPELRSSGAADELGMIECVQRPGETIYVPFGWWHAVLNIGFTAAVTANFVLPDTLGYIWPTLKEDWPDFAPKLARILKEVRPDVALPPEAEADAKAAVA
eukprot:TRINITY_DN32730_c0_g1_i1.p1 TRINITY_DN32730_c0_g1~~TRINITY_DN32730_c0_g1_i1.p1  ORF type:complete len:407 (+),score=107.09 TRINITY_DN32730_c0_g1_i1:70-1290(+)